MLVEEISRDFVGSYPLVLQIVGVLLQQIQEVCHHPHDNGEGVLLVVLRKFQLLLHTDVHDLVERHQNPKGFVGRTFLGEDLREPLHPILLVVGILQSHRLVGFQDFGHGGVQCRHGLVLIESRLVDLQIDTRSHFGIEIVLAVQRRIHHGHHVLQAHLTDGSLQTILCQIIDQRIGDLREKIQLIARTGRDLPIRKLDLGFDRREFDGIEFGLEVQHVPFHKRRVVDHLIQQSNLLAVADVHAATDRFQDPDTSLDVQIRILHLDMEVQHQQIVQSTVRLCQTFQGFVVLDLRILYGPFVDHTVDLGLIGDQFPGFQCQTRNDFQVLAGIYDVLVDGFVIRTMQHVHVDFLVVLVTILCDEFSHKRITTSF